MPVPPQAGIFLAFLCVSALNAVAVSDLPPPFLHPLCVKSFAFHSVAYLNQTHPKKTPAANTAPATTSIK